MWLFDKVDYYSNSIDKMNIAILTFKRGTEEYFTVISSSSGIPSDTDVDSARTQALGTLNKITDIIETDKEQVKPEVIQWIKDNPATTLSDFLAYVDTTYGWQNRALFERLLYDYSRNAAAVGLIPAVPTTQEEAWQALSALVAGAEMDVIMGWFN